MAAVANTCVLPFPGEKCRIKKNDLLGWGSAISPRSNALPLYRRHAQRRRVWESPPCHMTVNVSAQSAAPKLVTVLGKGGAGKTTAAVLLAKYYASTGKRTCFVSHSPDDRTADELIGHPISPSRVTLPGDPLTVIRLETTKLILEPLSMAKQLDARLGFSQGALNEVVGDELSILPGFDSLTAVAALEGLLRPSTWGGILSAMTKGGDKKGAGGGGGGGGRAEGGGGEGEFDVVVYDGLSSAEVLRMVGAPERSRWYLRRFREVAEKTDVGRVVLPSVARFVDSALGPPKGGGERSTSQVWETAENILTDAISNFQDPLRFSAFLVVDPSRPPSVSSALRLWGGAMQSGVPISGVLVAPHKKDENSAESVEDTFAPLPILPLPILPYGAEIEWANSVKSFKEVFGAGGGSDLPLSVVIDVGTGTVKLFLPGFDKKEVKLSQRRQASELVIEVGDQRRNIAIPASMRGKVVGAKFEGRSLIVTLKKT